MGQRKYPPLTPTEVIDILLARGFSEHHKRGDHVYYVHEVKGKKHIAQVDTGCPAYNGNLIKKVLKESGLSREQFYCSTKTTAKKINKKCATTDELVEWVLV